MALVVTELLGREGSDSQRQRKYTVYDDASPLASLDDAAVFDAVIAASPGSVLLGNNASPPYATNIALPRTGITNLTEVGPNRYEATVTYGPDPGGTPAIQPALGEWAYEFETSLESQQVFVSRSTVATYRDTTVFPNPGDAPNFGGAIQVTDKGAEGVDVLVPTSRFLIRFNAPADTVTSSYQLAVENLVGKVNNATFLGRAAGTVLFEGVTGSLQNYDSWSLTFSFRFRANRTGIQIGNIAGIAVDGWDLLWVFSVDTDEPGVGKPLRKPHAVYVERVYDRGDFSALGL